MAAITAKTVDDSFVSPASRWKSLECQQFLVLYFGKSRHCTDIWAHNRNIHCLSSPKYKSKKNKHWFQNNWYCNLQTIWKVITWCWIKRFGWNTIIKQQKWVHYVNLQADLLDNMLVTCPILTGFEVCIEQYCIGLFRCINTPDCQFGDGSVLTRSCSQCNSPDQLLTLRIAHKVVYWGLKKLNLAFYQGHDHIIHKWLWG